MAVYTIARYQVRPEASATAEQAMRDFADYVRRELPDSSWTTYREREAPTRFVAMARADDVAADARHRASPGMQAFAAAMAPLLVGEADPSELELVTSSDLQRRWKGPSERSKRRPRPR